MHVLIVDTDPAAAAVIRDRLREIGCTRSSVVTTGDEALCTARARQADLDLVILDLAVADSDGYVVCRRLSALLPNVPILARSPAGDEEALARAFDAGAHDVIPKPLRAAELVVRARAALRLREERTRRLLHEQRLLHWARQLEKSKRDLESTVCIDPLTGIANRRHFDTLLRTEWRRAEREGTSLSIVFFDIDHFHAFNEEYGHVSGDACLMRVASTLAHGLRRASDVLARYGGEEFVAVLPDTDTAGACTVAERLRAGIEQLQIPHRGSPVGSVLTISAGVASRLATESCEALIEAADAALYRAKHEGRNRYRAHGLDAELVTVTRKPWPSSPVVVLDPVLVQRVPGFLAATLADISAMRAVIRDVERLHPIASRVRYVANALGLEELGALAAAVETTVNRETALDELAWYVEHVQVVYRRAVLRAV